MAEKNEHDDDEKAEKDESVAEEEAKEKAALAAEKDAEEDDDEDDDDEEGEAPKPAAKPVAAASTVKPTAGKRPGAPLVKARPVPVRKSGSLGKSMILFIVIVGVLGAAFVLLGEQSSSGPSAPKWKKGDTADVELTLVADDKKNLACASPDEIGGAHCAFEAQGKPSTKGDSADDKKLLKPYTTTDHVQLLASGVWSDPALGGALPATRFSVKCKLKVEDKMKAASIRWANDGPWYDSKDLFTGSISGCKLVQ